jgi:FdhD protein
VQKSAGVLVIKGCIPDILCDQFSGQQWTSKSTSVPDEAEITIYVNRQELVTIMCTPSKLNFLVLGFLYTEGIISGMNDVLSMRVCDDESEVDVRLTNSGYKLPALRTLTSGCGGGTSFKKQGQKVDSNIVVTPMEVFSLMKQLLKQMELYHLCGGVHASAISDTKRLLIVSEDIGRHNTVDKIQGECLIKRLPTKDRLLLSTGRISSEMLLKAAKMQVPIVISRTSPTSRAVSLACDLGITLIGYAHGNRLLVYSHPERLDH